MNLIINRTTHWTNELITNREMEFEFRDADEFLAGQVLRVEQGPGIKKAILTSPVNGGWVVIHPSASVLAMTEGLQDGECPACRASWGNMLSVKCTGCGHYLDGN